MSAMEKMVASMLGITPDEMQEMLAGFKTLLTDLSAKLNTIETTALEIAERQAEILAKLEAQNDSRSGSGPSRNPKRGTGRGSGDASGDGGTVVDTGDGSGTE